VSADLSALGLAVGHATDHDGATGLTIVRGVDRAFRCAASVIGRATGTRELHAASPFHLVDRVDAVLLTGGSAYGLDAAAGAMRWMEEHGRGHPVTGGVVPIIPAAVIFDLVPLGSFRARPTPQMAWDACETASSTAISEGSIGAGTGAVTTFTETPTLNIAVTGNTISQTDGNGILLVARDAAGHLNAGVRNNNVAAPLAGVRPGIRLDAGNTNSTDDAVCADISGNTSAGSGGSQGIGLRKQGTVPTTNDFGIEGMAATGTPGVESFVDGQNPAGNGTLLISAASGFSSCNTAP